MRSDISRVFDSMPQMPTSEPSMPMNGVLISDLAMCDVRIGRLMER